jgi:GTP cyclohydrolase I
MSNAKDLIARKLLGNETADKYVDPLRVYDSEFKTTPEYKESLPDLQNDIYGGIREKIEHVGIHNFRLPLKYDRKDGSKTELETKVTGTVSLEASSRGINMSRIIRTFYEFKDREFNTELLEEVLTAYRKKIGSYDAKIFLNISYPMLQESLRTGLSGYQYYNVSFEIELLSDGSFNRYIHFDFVYSSACPCSKELAEHARKYRNRDGIPHSQRSVARVSVKYDKHLWIEDLQQICADALKTETQVMVLREDEQAFAELNGSYPKFVEDAARLLFRSLDSNPAILDFKVVLSHLESLHSHNAISVIIKDVPGGFDSSVSVEELNSLVR